MDSDLLYHYTGSDGLLGILSTSSLWATHIAYFSDRHEYIYTIDLFLHLVEERAREIVGSRGATDVDSLMQHDRPEAALYGFLKAFTKGTTNLDRLNCFVCSFSEEGNLLSQWRSYCPSSGGFSLGFDKGYLQELASNQGGTLLPCIYRQEEQRSLLRELLDEALQRFRADMGCNDRELLSNREAAILWPKVAELAARAKDPGFYEEKEWRFVFRRSENYPKPLHFRAGRKTITPYVHLDLPKFRPAKLYVGPSSSAELAEHSVRWLLSSSDVSSGIVERSAIPYDP